jgi:enoyl-CoA hydratase/carnithine racemase
MRYMLTGDEWGAEESYRHGLTQAVAPPGKELGLAVDFAKKIAAAAPLGVRAALASAHRAQVEGETAAFAALLPEFTKLFRTEDFQERIRAARENRPPVYRGR